MGRGDAKNTETTGIMGLRSRPPVESRKRAYRETKNISYEIYETGYETDGQFILHSFDDLPAKRLKTEHGAEQSLWFQDGVISRDPNNGPARIARQPNTDHSSVITMEDFIVDGELVLVDGFSTIETNETSAYTSVSKHTFSGDVLESIVAYAPEIRASYRHNSVDGRPSYVKKVKLKNVKHNLASIPRSRIRWHVNERLDRSDGPAEIEFFNESCMPRELRWLKNGKYVFDENKPNEVALTEEGMPEVLRFKETRDDHNESVWIRFDHVSGHEVSASVGFTKWKDKVKIGCPVSPEEAEELREFFLSL